MMLASGWLGIAVACAKKGGDTWKAQDLQQSGQGSLQAAHCVVFLWPCTGEREGFNLACTHRLNLSDSLLKR